MRQPAFPLLKPVVRESRSLATSGAYPLLAISSAVGGWANTAATLFCTKGDCS